MPGPCSIRGCGGLIPEAVLVQFPMYWILQLCSEILYQSGSMTVHSYGDNHQTRPVVMLHRRSCYEERFRSAQGSFLQVFGVQGPDDLTSPDRNKSGKATHEPI